MLTVRQFHALRQSGSRHLKLAAAVLEVICPVPCEADAVRLESQWERWSHTDLARLTLAEVAAERRRVELRILSDPAPDAWLGERLRAIREESTRRGG